MTDHTIANYQAAFPCLFADKIREGFTLKPMHLYRFGTGEIHHCVVRLERALPNGEREKYIRPCYFKNGKPTLGKPPPPTPEGNLLYNLDQIVIRERETVWWVEGEKCADSLMRLGLLATTSGSATSDKSANLTPLSGRHVVVWADADDIGFEHGARVAKRLFELGCVVEMLNVNMLNLPMKADCVDWLKQNPRATAEDIQALETYDYQPAPEKAGGLLSLSEVQTEKVNWIWKGWLARGKLTLLAGSAGQGKSTLALAIGAALSVGGRLPDGQRADGASRIVIANFEDGLADTTKARLVAAGANCDNVFAVDVAPKNGEPFDLSKDVPKLEAMIGAIGGADLLIVDPIVLAVAGDSHKNNDVRRGLQPLANLASALNCAVLGVHHFTKNSQTQEPLDRVTGGLAFGAVARVVMAVEKDKNSDSGRHVLARAKSNISRTSGGVEYFIKQTELDGGIETSLIQFGEVLSGSCFDILKDCQRQTDSENDTKQARCEAWLTDFLTNKPMLKKDVLIAADIEGFSHRTIERAAYKICHFGREKQKHGQSIWRLKSLLAPNAGVWRELTSENSSPSTGAASSEVLLAPSEVAPSEDGASKNNDFDDEIEVPIRQELTKARV